MNHSVLIGAEQIAHRVGELGKQISNDYADADELIMIGVLKGAFVFLADLARAMTIPRRIEFISVSSYGEAGDLAGDVRLLMDVRTPLANRHVLLIEDIVDTGHTLSTVLALFRFRGAKSVKLCALLDKHEAREVAVSVDYSGFKIDNVFVVGYGLDHDERFRELPYIGVYDS